MVGGIQTKYKASQNQFVLQLERNQSHKDFSGLDKCLFPLSIWVGAIWWKFNKLKLIMSGLWVISFVANKSDDFCLFIGLADEI